MHFVLGPPTESTRPVEDGTVIAVAEVLTQGDLVDAVGAFAPGVKLPIVGVEQGDWVEEVHVSRKNGDSRYGYILYLPLS